MFVGHLAVSLTVKVIEPKASLSALVAASFGLDLVWPFLVLAGVETVSVVPGNTAFTPLAFNRTHGATACSWPESGEPLPEASHTARARVSASRYSSEPW